MYLILKLDPSIKSLEFGENIHVEILYSKVHEHICSVLAFVREEEWKDLPLLPVGIELDYVFCFELVRISDFQGLEKI